VLKYVLEALAKRRKKLSSRESISREYAMVYAELVKRLKDEFDAKRFPVLKSMYEELSNSLTFNYGESLKKVTRRSNIQLAEKTAKALSQVYARGEVVCKRGAPGTEMYILQSGELGVYTDENAEPFARIAVSGEAIGEMSLLLAEPRTATVKAEKETWLSVIKRENLKDVAESRPDFFHQLGLTLCHRLADLIWQLQELKTRDAEAQAPPASIIDDPHHEAFMHLERVMFKAYQENDLPVFKELHALLRAKKQDIKQQLEGAE
jgi:CRP-like cAMP-binding protein